MQTVSAEQLNWAAYPGQRSTTLQYKSLFVGTSQTPDNFELYIVRIGETGSFSPRHRHNFEQFRLPFNGPLNQSPKQDIPKDHLGYIAEGTAYGPQDLPPGLEFLILQAGGPSGAGYLSQDELMKGATELKAVGEFSGGVYRRNEKGGIGDRINQDGYEAVWEHVRGRRIEYVRARYQEPITIDPEAFAWDAVPGASGVEQKQFGLFNERGTAAFQTRLAKNARHVCTADRGRKLLVVLKGAVTQEGTSYGPFSGFNLSPGESVALAGASEDPTVILTLQLAQFTQ